jgi:cytochrome c oxidase subunit IV
MVRPLAQPAQRFGRVAALSLTAATLGYAVVLAIALLRLPSADQPIRGLAFVTLELLILAIGPLMIAVAVAIHTWVDEQVRVYSLCGVVGMSLTALITCCVHFVILSIGRQPLITEWSTSPLLLSFTWPSITYALDILAWDVFFPLGALALAMTFHGSRAADWIRRLLSASAILAFAGLLGVALNDMAWRNIGIVGYAVVFPIAVALIATMFHSPQRQLYSRALPPTTDSP